jgi:5-methylcytosine-specific restriction endonuclease McrA
MTDKDATPEESEDLSRQTALFFIDRAKETLARATPAQVGRPYVSREECPSCGTTDARILRVGTQNTVRCADCGRHLYNASKVETGELARAVQTVRKGIKPNQQARIFDRDGGRCIFCRQDDEPLTIGHLLSVEDGVALGATTAELNDDSNLAAMCEACNLGLNSRSISPRTYAIVMWRLLQAEQRRSARNVPLEKPAPQTRN